MTTDAEKFIAKARAHWTEERESKVTGGKSWLIQPSLAPMLLRVLGLLNGDASMSADSLRKFSQLNHMLTLLKPSLEDLCERHQVVRILDACCGTSFVALVSAWLIRDQWGKSCEVFGIDSNPRVISESKRRAAALGYDQFVRFAEGDIGTETWSGLTGDPSPRPNAVFALHACDTATDHAFATAIDLKADVIAVAPCCHAELANTWKAAESRHHPLGVVFRTPNLRRETAAHITDAMRVLLVRGCGYEVTATEFVPSAHTPKNRLLLCTRRGLFLDEARAEYLSMKSALLDAGITLERFALRDGK